MKKFFQLVVLSCFTVTSLQLMGEDHVPCKKINTVKYHKTCFDIFSKKPPSTSNHSLYPIYFIANIAANKTLTAYEGTVWNISKAGRPILSTWTTTTPFIITVNTDWFSSYVYRLKNTLTQETVLANISQGPSINNAVLINNITKGTLSLSNKSIWTVEYWNRTRAFKKWAPGDAILVGEITNDSIPYYILINVNKNNFVIADYTSPN